MQSLVVFTLVVLSMTNEICFAQDNAQTNTSAAAGPGNQNPASQAPPVNQNPTTKTAPGNQNPATQAPQSNQNQATQAPPGNQNPATQAPPGGDDNSAAIFLSPSMRVLAPVLAASIVALMGSIY